MWLSLFLCVNNFSLMNHPIPCERGLVLGFGPNKILHSRSIFFEDENEHSTARGVVGYGVCAVSEGKVEQSARDGSYWFAP